MEEKNQNRSKIPKKKLKTKKKEEKEKKNKFFKKQTISLATTIDMNKEACFVDHLHNKYAPFRKG